ncbi:MAG: enoyl-CoA hydratase-related protein [Woeseiaceae bacterium]|nr:enoyl-CoA hydratase-related protein [Woeseiaceae bacterium]
MRRYRHGGVLGGGQRHLARAHAAVARQAGEFFQHAALAWHELPVPVIAALHGVVYGAGLQIAMGADLRIAAPSTRCSVMEIRWGIIPDMGLTATMRHLMRLDALRELVYTGRVVDADEARTLGLVTTVADEPQDAAMALARAIAASSPDAVRAAKRLLRHGFDDPVAASLAREAELQLGLLGTPNQAEAVRANLEKRVPRFTDASERS